MMKEPGKEENDEAHFSDEAGAFDWGFALLLVVHDSPASPRVLNESSKKEVMTTARRRLGQLEY